MVQTREDLETVLYSKQGRVSVGEVMDAIKKEYIFNLVPLTKGLEDLEIIASYTDGAVYRKRQLSRGSYVDYYFHRNGENFLYQIKV